MSGYVSGFGFCYCCGKPFSYNPMKVPSVRDPSTGHREPICSVCIGPINEERIRRGLEPGYVAPDAYNSCPEEEVDWDNG